MRPDASPITWAMTDSLVGAANEIRRPIPLMAAPARNHLSC